MEKNDDTKKEEKKAVNERTPSDEHSLKGTFVFIMLLGVFLLASWVCVFALFIGRN